MLRTNLSTRPFYNERLIQLLLGVAALVIVGLTVFNVAELRLLSTRHDQLLGRVGDDEKRATKLRADAEGARRSVDRAQLERVAEAAREANQLIDQRTFSWTELLNRLEATLPAEVRIRAIRPETDKEGHFSVTMVVLGHRAEDIEQFAEQLEATGAFHHLYSRTETTTQQGLLEVALEARYTPSLAAPPAARPLDAAQEADSAPAAAVRPGRQE